MNEGVLIPIFALLVPITVAPTAILAKQRQRKRELLHRERMRAIELGMPVPPPEHGLGQAVALVGGGVPIVTALAAFLTSMSASNLADDPVPVLGVIWGCATMISMVALLTAIILGFMAARSSRPVEQSASLKPAYDPDAYDVVSRRG
ncbi:hypothetical protein OJF2_16060 [Aquisphaera giovannonii]|uniref:MotA/TolQ/ExbB proton channel domain-containing protein n=1 Tax=Aquisphaera giovannonii TaxID=406548 RepID=A0A5B9VY81_9BACT|nr:hypothetical protein [Aquisphaera giovannonii]QEH33109.1 hypothetical protein OJF2_16060 [Aquisphaera giovannonii]